MRKFLSGGLILFSALAAILGVAIFAYYLLVGEGTLDFPATSDLFSPVFYRLLGVLLTGLLLIIFSAITVKTKRGAGLSIIFSLLAIAAGAVNVLTTRFNYGSGWWEEFMLGLMPNGPWGTLIFAGLSLIALIFLICLAAYNANCDEE